MICDIMFFKHPTSKERKMKKLFIYTLLLLLLLSSCARSGNPESEESSLPITETHTPAETEALPRETDTEEESATEENIFTEGSYLGVKDYGNISAKDMDSFKYLFLVNGEAKSYTLPYDSEYKIQNILKHGESYEIYEKNGHIEDIRLVRKASASLPEEYGYRPGEKTLKNLLTAALAPMGSSLYVYGGGWNWQDNGSSLQCRSIGVSTYWSDFFSSRDSSYSYLGDKNNKANSFFPHGGWNEYYYAGLDCSGYIGWVVYNVLNTESGNEGFVASSSHMARSLGEKDLGSFTPGSNWKKEALSPGDIVSIKGHVWMCIGVCSDGSAVIAHSTPSPSREGYEGGGVQLSAIGESRNCEAYSLADKYMKDFYPNWYDRYSVSLKSYEVYTHFELEGTGVFSWKISDEGTLSDPEGIRDMSAYEILEIIFSH